MAIKLPKEKTNQFIEVTDPKKGIGLWSYHLTRNVALTPVGNTKLALGRFLPNDVARWKRRHDMCEAMTAAQTKKNGKKKSSARIIGELLDKCKQDEKRLPLIEWRQKYFWLFLWQNYAQRIRFPRVVAACPDVQMFFGVQSAGMNCSEANLHSGRVFFLRKKKSKSKVEVEQRNLSTCASGLEKEGNIHCTTTTSDYTYFVAVVLKPGGTKWWTELERVNVTWTDNTYERLIIDPRGKLEWSPMAAEVLNEQVVAKNVCLFQLADDSLFKAITDPALNPNEKYAHLTTDFDFFYREGTEDAFYMRWSATFNPRKSKYTLVDRSRPRLVEVMGERGKKWLSRRFEVEPESDCDAVARWVVENNGCAVLPAGASDELRLALSRALFFVTFPDRKPDEVGGILRGYQLPGRLVEHAQGMIRANVNEKMKERMQKMSEEATARRRRMVVDCLFDRTCAAVLERNADKFTPDTVKIALDGIGAKAILEKAAWRWGFMEGNPLSLFKPSRTAGNLKLPDLSLALGFEQRLGLSGNTATIDRTVQTAKIAALDEVRGTIRDSISGVYPCRSVWTPKPDKEKEKIAYPADSARIIRDEGRYYLMAVTKFAQYNYGRDFAFEPDEKGKKRNNSVPVAAFHFESSGGVRSRSDVRIVEETFDYNKVAKLAREGRVYLYSIDFGKDKWLADLVYTSGNGNPCRIVSTVPVLVPVDAKKGDSSRDRKSGKDIETPIPADAERVDAFITFIFNPSIARNMRKWDGRSWKGYCDAIPSDSSRTVVRWPSNEGSAADALREVIKTDGVLLTDKEHLDEANRAAAYIDGYNLKDRVFVEDGRVDWRATQELSDKKHNIRRRKLQRIRQKERKGKPLVEIVAQPETLAALRREWVRLIEGDNLTDKKTAKVFTLEEPIRIGEEFKAMVEREFGRVAYTGTMKYQLQLVRPAHEVAVGIWLARLAP